MGFDAQRTIRFRQHYRPLLRSTIQRPSSTVIHQFGLQIHPGSIHTARQKAKNRLTDDVAKNRHLERSRKGNEKSGMCGFPVPTIKEPKAARQGFVPGTLKCPICQQKNTEVLPKNSHPRVCREEWEQHHTRVSVIHSCTITELFAD